MSVPIAGHALSLMRDPLRVLPEWARQYGDVYRIRVVGPSIWVFNHPDDIERILAHESKKTRKDAYTRRLRDFLGLGLVTSEGDFWRRQRRLSNPAFHHQRLAAYVDTMAREAARLVDGWDGYGVREIHGDMMRVTLEIVARTLFGSDVSDDATVVRDSLDELMHHYTGVGESGLVLPLFIPTPGNLRARRAIRRMDEVVARLVRERREDGRDRGDLLSMLIGAVDEDGESMNDVQLRDEVVTLLSAGHETTAVALTFTWFLLSQNPIAEHRLHAELDRVLGDRPPRFEDLPELRYANAVVQESMRLYPPVWGIGRETLEPIQIGEHTIPKGAQLFPSQWVAHRDPRFWDEPDGFRPERWLEPSDRPRFSYFPFGGGPRICIGKRFAEMEAVVLLAAIAQRYALRLAPGERLDLMPSVTIRPRHGLRMVVSDRTCLRRAA